jgi:hypothetical protein
VLRGDSSLRGTCGVEEEEEVIFHTLLGVEE